MVPGAREYEDWNQRRECLSGAAAAVLALAAIVATGGAASMGLGGLGALSGLTATVGSSVAGALGSATAGAMAAAGFSALTSTAITHLATNCTDPGQAFRDLCSKDTAKTLATSMLTAGFLNGAGLDAASKVANGLPTANKRCLPLKTSPVTCKPTWCAALCRPART